MKKKQTAKDIARLFEEKIGDDNLISDIFDYLQFDCKIRAFIDPNKLDEGIKNFYELQSVDSLIPVIDLILQGKEASFVEDKTLLADVKAYIIDHLDENLTVEQIAIRFHISYYYLCHLFKKMIHEDGRITQHCVRTVHAEQNAIAQAARRGIALEGSTLYCRMTPCRTCAMLIINCGIKRVVCQRKYHDGAESEAMFKMAGIQLEYIYEEVQQYDKQ